MQTSQKKMGVILSYASIAIGALITLFTNPLINNLMGKTELGISSVIISVTDTLTLLQMGMGTAYIRFYSRKKAYGDKKGIAQLNGMFLKIYAVMSIISLILGAILVCNIQAFFNDPLTPDQLNRARIAFVILTINTAIYFPSTVFDSYINVNERFIFAKTIFILKQFINPLVMIPLIAMGWGSVGAAVGTTAAAVICTILNIRFCVRHLHFHVRFDPIDREFFGEIVRFTSFVFITVLVDKINWSLDPILLGKFTAVEQAGIYNNADKLGQYFNTLAVTVSAVFAPSIHRMVANHQSDKALTALFIRVGRLSFIMLSLVFTGFYFFGKIFIYYWAGAELRDSIDVIYTTVLILFAAKLTPAIQSLGLQVQQAKNMHKVPAFIYLGTSILNIIFTVPLCQKFGAIGAATGTLLSTLIGNLLILNIYYQRAIGLNVLRFWNRMLRLIPAMIPAILCGLVMRHFFDLNSLPVAVVCGIVFCAVYALGMWALGFNNYEMNMIRKSLNRFLPSRKRG